MFNALKVLDFNSTGCLFSIAAAAEVIIYIFAVVLRQATDASTAPSLMCSARSQVSFIHVSSISKEEHVDPLKGITMCDLEYI